MFTGCGSQSDSKLSVTSLSLPTHLFPPPGHTQPGAWFRTLTGAVCLAGKTTSLLFSGPIAEVICLYQTLNFFIKHFLPQEAPAPFNNLVSIVLFYRSAYMSE